jgi:hypothetical protein
MDLVDPLLVEGAAKGAHNGSYKQSSNQESGNLHFGD